MKHPLSIILIVFFISFTSLQYSIGAKAGTIENISPAKIFKEYIAKHINSYKINKRERVTLLGGGWVKVQY